VVKLKLAAESPKKALSVDDEARIRIPDVTEDSEGRPLSIERSLSKEEFGALVMDLIQRSFKVCDEALQQAGLIARDLDGVILVGGPTRLSIIREAVTEYFQREPQANVDPDEIVAMGAAIHAESLTSEGSEAFLLDVTPLTLQIGVAGGLTETIIEHNTPVPIEQTRTFTTFKDHQKSVSIRIYQGESREATENELLGQFEFSDFRQGLRGEVEIDVTFEIDTDGIVNVTARDRATGEEASTRITLSSGLSDDELQSIINKPKTPRAAPERTSGHDDDEIVPLEEVVGEASGGSASATAPDDSGPILDTADFGPALETDAGDTEVELDDDLEFDSDIAADLDIDGDLEIEPAAGSAEGADEDLIDADDRTLDELDDDLEYTEPDESEVDSEALFEAPGVDLSEDKTKVE
jgi:hypothetical protein